MLAHLRFAPGGTIDEHQAPHDIDVVCLSGSGFASIGDETHSIKAGEILRSPRNVNHCLWTDQTKMETIMVERYEA